MGFSVGDRVTPKRKDNPYVTMHGSGVIDSIEDRPGFNHWVQHDTGTHRQYHESELEYESPMAQIERHSVTVEGRRVTHHPVYIGTDAYLTKDSGDRAEYASGMVRDTEAGKPRFDLLLPLGVPFAEQMLTRFAALMQRGAEKYSDRNWELAEGQEELGRYVSSALRHLVQYATGETDEDHAAAVMFNLMAAETVKYKLKEAAKDESKNYILAEKQWIASIQTGLKRDAVGRGSKDTN